MITSKQLVEAYGATLKGQQLLFLDDDIVLRRTPFKSIDKAFDREALIHWWMNVYVPNGHGDDNTPYEVFSSWSDAASQSFKYIYRHGYSPESNQTAISLLAYGKDPLEAHLEELNLWLPHIKPITDENGKGERKAKYISIMEDTCGQHGCYSMSVYSDQEITVDCLRYHHHQVLERFDCLENAVEFIKKNYWYKK